MSTYDDASLILIPSGVKDGKVYSAKPTNGGGDFTFTRASEATRLVDGVVTKVRTNRVLYSEDLSNAAWGKERSTVTSNAIANPLDGAVTADKIVVDSTADNNHSVYTLAKYASTNVQTFSVYLKAGEYTWAAIGSENSTYRGWFDLANGVVGSQNGGVTSASISDAGGGWYRCSLVIIGWPVNGIQMFATPSDATLNTVGVGSGGFYSYGVQLEQGTVATDYIATTTVAVSEGPVANMPRLNSVAGGCPSLLLEPQRTNLITQSEFFGSSYWIKTNLTTVDNAIASPDGYVNAAKLTPNTTNGYHYTDITANSVSSNALASVFAKKGEYQRFAIRSYYTGSYAVFDVNSGTVVSTVGTTATIKKYSDGWYRCALNETTNANYGYQVFVMEDTSTVPTSAFVGSGTDGIYVWGAQLEVGSYATSYIPTYGTAATRVADACYKTGISSLIGQTEGTLFMEFTLPTDGDGTSDNRFSLSSGSGTNWIFMSVPENGTSSRLYYKLGGVVYINSTISGKFTAGVVYRIALAYKSGDTNMYLNGVSIDSSVVTFPSPSSSLRDLMITGGSPVPVAQETSSNVSQVLLFTTRLTNAELATLTTL